jgi:quinohemoprotein ethanol dehydrogenase
MPRHHTTPSDTNRRRRAATRANRRVFRAFSILIFVSLCGGCTDTSRSTKETVASTDEDKVSAVSSTPASDVDEGRNWSHYGRDVEETHFSPLKQINDKNIAELGLSWFRDLPVMISSNSAPLAIDGVLYFAVGLSQTYALDAVTGRQLWHYDPDVAAVAGDRLRPGWGVRGIAFWDKKVFTGTQDGRLIAIDAGTGAPVWEVQTIDEGKLLFITGPPRVFNGKVIIGFGGSEYENARGYVTAYDGKSGKQLWRFYTVPGNPDVGFENEAMAMAARTWTGKWWNYGGGGNVWNAMTYDPVFNRIYLGTGNGSPWNRKIRSPGGGDNLFVCSIVALDADSGEYVWHYQTNPGETWDYNSAMDIQLATVEIDGNLKQVIFHAPKNGFFYVIDREDGKLLSAEPYARVNWATHIDLKTGRPVEVPGIRYETGETVIWPGTTGAHSWQAMAYNPQTRLVYIPGLDVPSYFNDTGMVFYQWRRTPRVLDGGINPWPFDRPQMDPRLVKELDGFDPVNFGFLKAWDPRTQQPAWTIRQFGMNGGVMTTAGNLVFQGQADGYLVARSADSGRELWRFNTQNGIAAQPITYSVNGKQYVTVITGYSASPAVLWPASAPYSWDYRNQQRRVLTFALGGDESLPAPAAGSGVIVDPNEEIDSGAADRAKVRYNQSCILCHGVKLVSGGAAPDLRKSPIPLSSEAFYEVVHGGSLESRGMPRFDELSRQEVEDLRQLVRSEANQSAS